MSNDRILINHLTFYVKDREGDVCIDSEDRDDNTRSTWISQLQVKELIEFLQAQLEDDNKPAS